MVKEHGDYFKVAFSLSGVGIEQLELHAPKVLDKLQELNQTGCVEFLAEPYSHGLSSLKDEQVFRDEVKLQAEKIKEYSDRNRRSSATRASSTRTRSERSWPTWDSRDCSTEGAQHVLGWKSPHYLYHCALNPNLKLLLRDYTLSDDIALRFSNSDWEEYPLFADNYIDKIAKLPEEEQLVNIFMNLSAIGISQPLSSGILEFLRALPECARKRGITFSTPTEVCMKLKSMGEANVPVALSWMDEERDVSTWLGNPMQQEAVNKLYSVAERVRIIDDPALNLDWMYLQASNNFRMMSTKQSNVGVERASSPRPSMPSPTI